MKKERFSFLILFVELAAIVLLHFAKNQQPDGTKILGDKGTASTSTYQLKALTVTKLK